MLERGGGAEVFILKYFYADLKTKQDSSRMVSSAILKTFGHL